MKFTERSGLMSLKHCDTPTLITGCARSGTSLIAGIIHACGARGGTLLGPNQWNERGMFENLYIRENLVKPYLKAIFADPKGQKPLPMASTCPPIQDWHEAFMDVLYEQGYEDSEPLFYKGAKMCLMWPVWHAAFPYARWVIVRRDDAGIIASCLRTPFMDAYKDAPGWQEWIDHHKECFDEMAVWGLGMFHIYSPAIVKGDLSGAREMIQWLGLEWDEERVVEFISPELWNGGKEEL